MTLFSFIMGLWISLYLYILGDTLIILKKNNFKTIIHLIIFSFLYAVIYSFQEHFISFLCYLSTTSIFLYLEFDTSMYNIFSFSFIIYLIRFIYEILFYIVIFIFKINFVDSYLLFVFTSILVLITSFFFKDYLRNIMLNNWFYTGKNHFTKYFICNLYLILVFFIRIYKYNFNFINIKYPILFLSIISFNLAMLLMQEKEKNDILAKNYKKTVEYSEFAEGLLSEYRDFFHEYKNKLIIIKGMISKRNKEAHKYINDILKEKSVNNYRWLVEIKNIPISGVKGIINFKLLKMKELGIDLEIYISDDIAKLKNDFLSLKEKNDLYTILGIVLDNAIEGSLESKNKLASFQFYKENNSYIIIVANTFKFVNIDRLDEKGFSTKGKNRGIGLHILNNLLKHHDTFKKETSIMDNFFVQKIVIRKHK